MRLSTLLLLAALSACRVPDDHFTGLADGGGDDAVQDGADAAGSCWPGAASNFDPCTLTPSTTDFTLTRSSTLNTTTAILTDDGTAATSTFGEGYPANGPKYLLAHYRNFTVAAQITLTVTTARPLLIVADETIDIQGTIDFTAATTTVDPDCVAAATPSGARGPGGSGGGYGAIGGIGGAGSVAAAAAMDVNGVSGLVPLRIGCPGPLGGHGTTNAGGGRGRAGGAIELNAGTRITINGKVVADGGGGGTGAAQSSTDASGGGGGGSGGSILIEAPNIDFANGAMLCAVGGGGGHGGNSSSITSGGNAGLDCVAGVGAPGSPGAGGDGSATGAGGSGSSGSTTAAGGGGGGAVGRIVLRGTTSGTPTSKPAYVNLMP